MAITYPEPRNPKGRTPGIKGSNSPEAVTFKEKFKCYTTFQGGFEDYMRELKKLKGEAFCRIFLATMQWADPKSTDGLAFTLVPQVINFINNYDIRHRGGEAGGVQGIIESS